VRKDRWDFGVGGSGLLRNIYVTFVEKRRVDEAERKEGRRVRNLLWGNKHCGEKQEPFSGGKNRYLRAGRRASPDFKMLGRSRPSASKLQEVVTFILKKGCEGGTVSPDRRGWDLLRSTS